MASIAAKAELFPELPFDAPNRSGLSGRDAALCRAIDSLVTRRWLTLTALLQSRIERPWQRVEAPLQAALLAGAAQLLFMDRIPDHAAVDESVNWAKEQRGAKAGGFVNAVLRKVAVLRDELLPAQTGVFASRRDEIVLPDGRAWRLREEIFADPAVERIAQVGSLGRELFLHWIAAHGFETARELAHHGLADPPTLLTGVLAEPGALSSAALVPHAQAGWYVWTPDAVSEASSETPDALPATDSGGPATIDRSGLLAFLQANPGMRVQDPASGDPVAAVTTAGLSPQVIVDFCAGRGTKTVQLALAFPNAQIIASDPDAGRTRDLSAAAARYPNIEVSTPAKLTKHFQSADLIVLDVPCSNTAVLPRRPEAGYRFSSARLAKLIAKQREVATGAMPLLKPGGHMLYSTCSLEPTENARQADAIRKRFGFLPRGERQRFPTGVPGEPSTQYSDGGFWSLAVRRG